MENKGQQFKNICEEMLTTFERKNHDYGDSFTQTVDKFGYVASAIRMHDKLERFTNLVSKKDTPSVDEPMRDTLLDLANYAIMTVMHIDDKTKQASQQKTINFV